MRDALLALLLALANGEPTSAMASAPATARGMVAPPAVSGVWAGEWADGDARGPVKVEAAFTTATAKKVLAHFTFIDKGVRRTVLRQGVSVGDGFRLAWPGGRTLDLRLTASDRLEGAMMATRDGAATVAAGSVSLSRRPR